MQKVMDDKTAEAVETGNAAGPQKYVVEPATWAEAVIAKAKSLFDDAEGENKPEAWERGANGSTLKWYPACSDDRLERNMLGRVKKLMRQHPFSILEQEDIANRVRRRLEKGDENYSASDGDWEHYAARIVTNEMCRFAAQLERECEVRKAEVSRDGSDTKLDTKGDAVRWREHLDDRAAFAVYDNDQLKCDIEEAIAAMEDRASAALIRRYYEGEGLRTLAKSLGRPLSSFTVGEWATAKNEFRKVFSLNTLG